MRRELLAPPTLLVRPSLPQRWLTRLLGREAGVPEFAVRIPDIELRRSGHISTGPAEAVQVREEFRAIKKRVVANLSSDSNGRDPRVVLVTSARPGEGKTFVALNLALNLAVDRNLAVTLVDADPVGQGLTRKLALTGRGLLDALDSGGDVSGLAQDTNVTNLQIVSAGRGRSDAPELLSSGRMGMILDGLASGVVVLDSGALLSGSSASVLAGHSGQVVFVIACHETGRQLVDESLSLLDTHIGPLESANIGLVLNKISPAQSAARYSASTA